VAAARGQHELRAGSLRTPFHGALPHVVLPCGLLRYLRLPRQPACCTRMDRRQLGVLFSWWRRLARTVARLFRRQFYAGFPPHSGAYLTAPMVWDC